MNDKDAKSMANKTTPADLQDDLTLKLWDGDDSAKGAILKAWGGRTMLAIIKGYPSLSADEIEDVISESMLRFWVYREKYDPARAKIGTLLYKIATRVASEHISGQLSWQKARIKEEGRDAQFFADIQADEPVTEPPDDVSAKPSPVQKALADCYAALPDLQRDILQAYGQAGHYPLEAATLGKEMGHKHKQGVPIPAVTIRVYRKRAWDNLELCMKKKNFDLQALGYTDE